MADQIGAGGRMRFDRVAIAGLLGDPEIQLPIVVTASENQNIASGDPGRIGFRTGPQSFPAIPRVSIR
jgi:hypothetical protein